MRRLIVACTTALALILVKPSTATHSYDTSSHSARYWHARFNDRGDKIRRLSSRRIAPGYRQLIRVASVVYRVPYSTLYRKARCESAGFSDFYNEGSGASGAFQFLPSTFRSTPFAGFSIFDPVANVFAGAWMHARGRGGEWVCR